MYDLKSDALVDVCMKNVQSCTLCLSAFSKVFKAQSSGRCVDLLMSCSAICRLNATFAGQQNQYAKQLSILCAQVCRACSAECEQYGNRYFRYCAKTCLECGQECERFVAKYDSGLLARFAYYTQQKMNRRHDTKLLEGS